MDYEAVDNMIEAMNRNDFCFIIGAGASCDSKIRAGAELASDWLKYLVDAISRDPGNLVRNKLHPYFEDDGFKKISPEQLRELVGNDTVDECMREYMSNHFSWDDVIRILFRGIGSCYFEIATFMDKQYPRTLQKTIYEEMQGKIASKGYSYFAKILEESDQRYHKRNIVITTNFDDLILQAVYANYKEGYRVPALVPHRALAKQIERLDIEEYPIIFKVHHDFLFSPLNTGYDVQHYTEDVKNALSKLTLNRALLVIGYAGADDALMRFLIEKDRTKIYWGYYDKTPRTREFELLSERHQVFLFEAGKFDAFMEYLYSRMFNPSRTREQVLNNIYQHDDISQLIEENKRKIIPVENFKSAREILNIIKVHNQD